MTTLKKVGPILLVIVLLGGAGGAAWWWTHRPAAAHRHDAKAVYYCPMHPTYTSDKPGDCPICNMKLVKREETSAAPQAQPQTAKDVCYMHNCPKVHEGRPCPMLVVAKAGERVTCPICGTHVAEAAPTPAEKKILYWTDPMMPGYKSDKPGKSPMGMEMVPVYEEVAAAAAVGTPEGYAPILVTPQKQQFIGVKTATVEKRALATTVRTVGTVARDPELYQTEAEYQEAMRALRRLPPEATPETRAQAERLVESSRVKLRRLGLNDALIEEVGALEEPERSLLYAGAGGRVWIYAAIYEYELPLVRVGDDVTVELTATPGQTLHGTLRAVNPTIDPMTRTATIRVLVEDTDAVLKPDMYVNVSIQTDQGEVLTVPEEAVFDTGTKKIIFVDKGQGLFEPRDVAVGTKAEGRYEVTSGVTEGERVVTSANFLIDSESRLKAALEGMSGGGGHQHGQ